MISDKQKMIIQFVIILLGAILGFTYLPSLIEVEAEVSGFIGGLVGFLVGIAIFPEMFKASLENPSEKRMERIMDEHQLGFYRYLTHPTQIPFMISMLIFVLLIVFVLLFGYLKIAFSDSVFQIALFAVAFLWGLSGFLMMIKKVSIDHRGREHRGAWAILNGLAFLLMGWGSIIFVLLAELFNW